jgi:RTX calcium-binding nonapeptide repeat (4 copies)
MANIIGTNGIDTLTGTAADDIIKGLSGNDRIISSQGADTVDGGAGNNDVIDYSAEIGAIYLNLDPNQYTVQKLFGDYSRDKIANVETVIGALNEKLANGTLYPANNNIFGATLPRGTTLDVDLSRNRLTYSSASIGTKTLNIKNFIGIFGAIGNNRLKGNDQDNYISIPYSYDYQTGIDYNYSSVIVASKGNDLLNNGSRDSTIDYSNIGRAVTINLAAYYSEYGPKNINSYSVSSFKMDIEKGGFGADKTIGIFNNIVGANDKENTIDINSISNTIGSVDVNLTSNLLRINTSNVNSSGFKSAQINVTNFVNVVGGKNNDTIVGANKKGKLTGGGGNDTVTGGNKNDRITGSDSTARGVGEVDTLTGGGGRDKFILGDANGAYYVGKGKDDYALITDFNLFQDSINLGGFKNYSFASGGNNTIDLYSGKDVNTRDLIAKIQIAGGISTTNSYSRSIAGSMPTIDSIIGKIDIVSGSDS